MAKWLAALAGGMLMIGTALAETTFTQSTIERIDQEHQNLTIRTSEGKTWSLELARPELLKGLKEGDRASLELSLDGKVHKIVKSEEGSGVGASADSPAQKEQ